MRYHLYAGTYTGLDGMEGGDGICHLLLDTETEKLSVIRTYREESDNPSFLAVRGDTLYAVSERHDFGKVTAFRIGKDKELTAISQVQTEGTDMCHLFVWPDGGHLSASNYRSGSLSVRELSEDGSIGKEIFFDQHEGKGVNPERQEGPHVHSTRLSPDGKRLYAADLGLDEVTCYLVGDTIERAGEDLQIHTDPGEGPRHFLFREGGKLLYLVTEMGCHLLVYRAEDTMHYELLQKVNLLEEGYAGPENTAADLHFTSDEKYLYVSNRGEDTIVQFRVNQETGEVEQKGRYSSGGRFPRNFCLTPDDRYMVIADQMGGTLCLLRVDPETGALSEVLDEVRQPYVSFVTVL